MEKYKDIVNKINLIIEQSNSECPKCKNCINHCDGACTFGCVNERSVGRYLFSQKKLTLPDYSCDNFKPIYSLNENTVCVLRDMVKDIERVNEDIMNLELMLDGKINENEFIELVKWWIKLWIKDYRNKGVSKKLIEYILKKYQNYQFYLRVCPTNGVDEYTFVNVFKRYGFKEVDRNDENGTFMVKK